ncbi:MAG: hypothetical protein AAF694_26905 [Bacteroidota bacterium]
MLRREFSKSIVKTVSSFALIDSLFKSHAFAKGITPIMDHGAEFCLDLHTEIISAFQWQSQMEKLYRQVELKEILKFIDFGNLIKGFKYPDLGVNTKKVKFPRLSGLPEQTVFVKKIFGMKKRS